ncbi:hypothetical protein ACWDA7_30350 [Streptomyces sp. NPDC001156]
MAIAFGSSSTNTAENAGSVTVSVPSGTADGDLLLLAVSVDTNGVTLSGVSGWTVLDNFNDTTDGERLFTYYRVASSEPSSYTITSSQSPVEMAGAILRYTGVDTTTPVHLHPTKTTKTNGTSLASPALTGAAGTDMSVLIWCHGAVSSGTYTQTLPGSPWTTRINLVTAFTGGSSFNVGIGVVDQIAATAAATDSVSKASGLMCTAVALTAASGPAVFNVTSAATSTTSAGTGRLAGLAQAAAVTTAAAVLRLLAFPPWPRWQRLRPASAGRPLWLAPPRPPRRLAWPARSP